MEKFLGAEFINRKYPDLPKSEQVNSSVEASGEEISDKNDKTEYWLNAMENFHKRHRDNPEAAEHIKNAFHKYVIKSEDIPESYFDNQQRLDRELGHGDIEITPETRKQGAETIIKDQKYSLDNWVDYLTSEDTDHYPMWVKYWAFRSVLKLSSYNKESKSFGNRRKDTVAPFPDLNREALSYVIDVINKKVKKSIKEKEEAKIKNPKDNIENIPIPEDNPELQKLIQGENFGKLYAYAIEKVTPAETNELLTTEGEWIKYDQGTDHMILVKSLEGKGTGWCTVGESMAETQINGGDFHVYYSKDKSGNPTNPRAAIRMDGTNQIAEVRGIAHEQNLDTVTQEGMPTIGEIVDAKLSEFPDKEKYQKKTVDMKFLTQIENKQKTGEELSKEDLRFLYEIDSEIDGFGYQKDPRIEEIQEGRDIKADLSFITGYPKEQISLTQEEALSGNIKFHYGDLNLRNLESAEGLNLPENVKTLYLDSLESAKGLNLQENVKNLYLYSLKSAKGLNLPENVKNLYLYSLKSAKGLNLPENVEILYLNSLESAEGLNLPENVKNLYLYSLKSAKGLNLPENVKTLNLYSLESAEKEELRKKYPKINII